MISPRLAQLFLAALALFAWTRPAPAQGAPEVGTLAQPEFTSGDVDDLRCKIVSYDDNANGARRLVVEVSSRAALAGEPIEFEIQAPAEKSEAPGVEVFARGQLPRVARYGRPVPAGGKERYELATNLRSSRSKLSVKGMRPTAARARSGLRA